MKFIKRIIVRLLGGCLSGYVVAFRTQLFRAVKKSGWKKNQSSFPVRDFSHHGANIFFGYYDITPFSDDERFLLAVAAPIANKSPAPETEVEVGYFILSESDEYGFKVLGTTTAWCWQQGARLQWFPLESRNHIIYNAIVDGEYGASVRDLETGRALRSYCCPIYALSSDGRWGLSLNFSRLQRLRPGYGYNSLPDRTSGDSAPEDDGIWLVDMKSGQQRLIVSLAAMAEWALDERDIPAGAEHYFNHLCFNPTGDRFLFFHIYNAGSRRIIRVITSDLHGQKLFPLECVGMVSHFSWISDQEIVLFGGQTEADLGYYIYFDQTDRRKKIGDGILRHDGHPSYSHDGRFMLTDTYPDRLGNQHLLLFDIKKGKLETLGSFLRPTYLRGEWRCDLHPRWSPSGRLIAFDSAHSGKRSLCVLDLAGSRYYQKADEVAGN